MSILGKAIAGEEYITQLIQTTLQVHIGSLVMRRDWGSNVFESVDSKNNDLEKAVIFAKIANCLQPLRKFLFISSINAEIINESSICIEIAGFVKINGIWRRYNPKGKMIINQYFSNADVNTIFNLQTTGTAGSTALIDTTGNTTITNPGGATYTTISGFQVVRANNSYLSVSPTGVFSFGSNGLRGVTFDVEWIANSSRPTNQTPFFASATDTGSLNGFFFGYDEPSQVLHVYERERFVISHAFPVQPLVNKKISICIYIDAGAPGLCEMFIDGIKVATGNFTNPYGQNSIEATDKVSILSSLYYTNNDYFKSLSIRKGIHYT